MLRKAMIVVAVLTLVIAAGLLSTGSASATTIGVWLAIEAVVLLLALFFERGRYRPSVSGGPWIPTTERFQDPSSGRWIKVEYNPQTGERRYVEER
jgi:hypothetical protein